MDPTDFWGKHFYKVKTLQLPPYFRGGEFTWDDDNDIAAKEKREAESDPAKEQLLDPKRRPFALSGIDLNVRRCDNRRKERADRGDFNKLTVKICVMMVSFHFPPLQA